MSYPIDLEAQRVVRSETAPGTLERAYALHFLRGCSVAGERPARAAVRLAEALAHEKRRQWAGRGRHGF